jgi:hypothetical protein
MPAMQVFFTEKTTLTSDETNALLLKANDFGKNLFVTEV